MSRRLVVFLAVLPVLAAGCGGGRDDAKPARSRASQAEQGATPVPAAPGAGAIASTLDGKRVLPRRLRWVATPHVGGAQISAVRFLIDGTERWVEHEAPFVYGSDDAGTNRGFLITTWLGAGRHRFTVEASDVDDHTYRRTVTARVLSAPLPPAALAGRWQHPVPGGRWDLIFDRIGAWHLDPEGTGLVNQVDITGNPWHLAG